MLFAVFSEKNYIKCSVNSKIMCRKEKEKKRFKGKEKRKEIIKEKKSFIVDKLIGSVNNPPVTMINRGIECLIVNSTPFLCFRLFCLLVVI